MSNSSAPQYAPADATAAKKAMNDANAEWDHDGDCDKTRDLAYVAERKAEYAEAQASIAQSTNRLNTAQQQLATLATQQASAQRQAALDAQQQAQSAQAMSAQQAEQAAQQNQQLQRQLADERTKSEQAIEALGRIANVRREAKGLVINLTGSLLFETGKWTLRPIAHERLEKVAEALKQADSKERFVVEGHTDSRGSDELNQTLSDHRAQAVKDFLVSRGVPEERISAIGMGKEDPVASNRTAEGRADNRRVDIVMQETQNPNG
jgi:outer membrane protein OmpA-like peptidoglycan-associated protein